MRLSKKRLFPRGRGRGIKLVVLDVDGVLTDGKIVVTASGDELKNFSVYDGVGIKLGQRAGLKFAIITARASKITEIRAAELGIADVFQVSGPKEAAYEELKTQKGLSDSEVAYIGDDIHDAEVMKRAGLSIAVANAQREAREKAHYITSAKGGEGAVREAINLIMGSKGQRPALKTVFAAAACLLLVSCSRSSEKIYFAPPASGETEAGEGEKFEGGFVYTVEEGGKVVLEIRGASAAGLGREAAEIIIDAPRARWHESREPVVISAAKASLGKSSGNVIFRGDASAESDSWGRIRADYMEWIKEEGRLTAKNNVEAELYLDAGPDGVAR